MSPTGIEWVLNPDGTRGITLNSKTGCLNHTAEGLCLGGLFPCYAWKLAHGRLRPVYLNNLNVCETENRELEILAQDQFPFYPRWWPERLEQIRSIKRPTGIFLDDMSDWMGDYWPRECTEAELQVMRECPQHRFYTLTKQPQNLPEFSPFPDNCWVGVTATNASMAWIASKYLSQIEAGVKFLSLEPLLSWKTSTPYTTENIVAGLNGSLDLIISGACTGTLPEMASLCERQDNELAAMPWGNKWTAQPKVEWLREIVDAVDRAGIFVFLKDNLRPLLVPEDCSKPNYLRDDMFWASDKAKLRQELPDPETVV